MEDEKDMKDGCGGNCDPATCKKGDACCKKQDSSASEAAEGSGCCGGGCCN